MFYFTTRYCTRFSPTMFCRGHIWATGNRANTCVLHEGRDTQGAPRRVTVGLRPCLVIEHARFLPHCVRGSPLLWRTGCIAYHVTACLRRHLRRIIYISRNVSFEQRDIFVPSSPLLTRRQNTYRKYIFLTWKNFPRTYSSFL